MIEVKKYNGWTNYETWAWKLWMDNEEGSYRHWQDRTRNACRRAVDRDEAVTNLIDELESECDDNKPELTGPYSDLLSAAVSEINFHEIAVAMIDDEEYDFDGEDDSEIESEDEE